MTIEPGNATLTVYQGADFDPVVAWTNEDGSAVNLTGFTAEWIARENVNSVNIIFNLTTSSGLTINPALGTISALISGDTTANICKSGVHNLKLVSPSGKDYRLLEGVLNLSPQVPTP